MQNVFYKQINRWLWPAVLILLLLSVILMPFAVNYTWADQSGGPDHTLTYTVNALTWDSATGIRADGSAVLELFDSEYDGTVKASDGRDVVAPGTAKSNLIRLKSDVSGSVTYTAVLYEIKSDDQIPVTASISASGAANTTSYPLPTGVTQDQVVQAITGTVSGKQLADITTAWNWAYDESAAQDVIDTQLAIQETSPEVSVGLYIVVEDGNSYVTPDVPKTGDDSNIGFYAALMAVSVFFLLLLFFGRRQENESESN